LLHRLRLHGEPLDLNLTMDCGQIFRWNKQDDYWKGWLKGSSVALKVEDDELLYRSNPELDEEAISSFLTLDIDYQAIYRGFPDDEMTRKLILKYRGLRILRQDPWECFVSYIISASMSIRTINSVLDRICRQAYPTIDTPPIPAPSEFLSMRPPRRHYLGKKWKYIEKLAKTVIRNRNLFDEYRTMGYHDAWNSLVKGNRHVFGVGPKVADCVLLFSLDKFEAFPIDRWVLRGLKRYYPILIRTANEEGARMTKTMSLRTYSILSEVSRRYFGRYCGVLQECLFLASRLDDSGIL